jgi:hypothetical protein
MRKPGDAGIVGKEFRGQACRHLLRYKPHIAQMSEAERRAEVFTEFDPMVLRNGKKHLDDFGIKLGACTAPNFLTRVRHGKGIAVGAVAQHGIEGIGDGKDTCSQRDLFAAQAARIAGTVEKLLVSKDDLGGLTEERDAGEHIVANIAVGAHSLLFSVVERAGLAKNLVGDGHLADVMKKGGSSQNLQIMQRYGNCLGNGNGVGRDALRVALGFRVLEVQGAAQRFESVVVGLREELERGGQFRSLLLDFLLEVELVILVFGDELAVLPGAADGMEELVLLERFEDVVIGAAANGLERGGDVVDGGDHNDGDFRVETSEPIEKLDAIHFRHDHIAEDEVRRLFADELLCGAAVAKSNAVVAAGLQHRRNNFSDSLFIIHYQDMSRVHEGVSPKHHYMGGHTQDGGPLPSKKIAC